MYQNKRAFTLIELLVVVLIVGILAAVAVPQYQKAVLKSRYASLKSAVNAIAKAQQMYFMANGEYARDIDALSLDFPKPNRIATSGDSIYYHYDRYYCVLTLGANLQVVCGLETAAHPKMAYEFFSLLDGKSFNSYCLAYTQDANDIYHQLCKQERKNNFVAP